jgi:hypothetical protein
MKHTLLLFTLINIFLSTICFSQSEKATLFFNDGDSIDGYGYIDKNKIKFRVSLDSKGDFWSFDMVSKVEYETLFGKKTFEYIYLNDTDDPVIMELITKGEVSLYRQTESSWVLDNSFPESYISVNNFPNNRKVTKVTHFLIRRNEVYPSCLNCGIINKWKKRTKDFLIDCPGLIKKIESDELREIHLQEIVQYYNDFCLE